MGQKIKLISSIISLGVTLLLLICVCFGWYIVNHDAKASGITASVVDPNNLIESGSTIEYYDIVSIENNVCKIGAKNVSRNINLEPYDPLSTNINQKLMVIPIASGKTVKIKAVSKVKNYVLGERNPSTGQAASPLNKANNSLSSIIGFYYIPELETGSSTGIIGEIGRFSGYTFDLPTESSHFVTINDSNDSNPYTYVDEIYITPTAGLQVTNIYILLGYYPESVEYVYTLNIGNENLNLDIGETISYESDFYITIEEA